MVVTFNRFGRLANRLFLFSHLIAFAEKAGVVLVNLSFDEYAGYFGIHEKASTNPYVPAAVEKHSGLGSVKLLRLGASLGIVPTVRFWDDRDIVFDGEDKDDPRIRMMRNSRRIVFEGWKFRSHFHILNIMPLLRSKFLPCERIRQSVSERMREARNRGDIVVGVHIRWEDYRGTSNYFESSEYVDRMKHITSLLRPAKMCFLLCSSEKLRQQDFPAECFVPKAAEAVEDLYSLALCDFLVGPASTFSRWASFYGGKPLFTIRHDQPINDLAQAEVVQW